MNKLIYTYFIIMSIGWTSCTETTSISTASNEARGVSPSFYFIADTINAPDSINWITFHDNTIILKSKDKYWCWNTLMELDSLKTRNLNKKKFSYTANMKDALIAAEIIQNKPYYYILDSNFNWKKLKTPNINDQKMIWYDPYTLEDSIYNIYACCEGEFGGMLYFQNKQTGIKTGCMVTCTSQILYFEGAYFVVEYLSHMGVTSNLIRIKDPSQLAVLPSDTLICSYWRKSIVGTEAWDSLSNALTKGTEIIYSGGYDSLLSLPFIYKDQLLSIISDERRNKMYLSRYENGKMSILDTLPKKYLSNHFMSTYQIGNELWFNNSTYKYRSIGHLSNDTFRIYYLKP